MKSITRALSLIAVMAVSFHANAAVLKFSTAYPDGTYVVKTLKAAGKDIEAKTEGRIKLKFYPGGVQGDNKTVLKKIKRGILHGALLEGGAMGSEFKDGQVYNAPMAFNNYDEVNYVRERMDAELLQGYADAGWKMFGFIDGGFAYAMTNKAVSDIEGLKQQKLWLPANDPLSEKVANALGLSPIYLGIGEVLTALQTGAIDAIAAPPAAALTLQWYSKVKHVTDAPFMYTYGTLALADKAFSKLSTADQQLVDQVLTEAISNIDSNSRADNLKAFDALASQGLTITAPNAEAAARLKTQADKATATLVEQGEFSAERLARLNALLAEARSQAK
ncbi:MAG: TRAP-type C4-dicarboxylate transport system substrate-binding protein [Flavobacteriales bacterium]|jgi:TRAP-type C4-dicarboxylate transport system substrate-binding protein